MLTLITFEPWGEPLMMPRTLNAMLSRLWSTNRPLTAVGLLMTAALIASSLGLVFDTRTILGAPAWLKPAKFAVSTAIYSFTLAWVFTYLPDWPRTQRIVGWMTAVVFVFEVGIIDAQAWRGTTSHFNVNTPVDAALFSIMGVAIVGQTIASAFVAFALWRQPISNRAMGAALRAGMVITLVGAASGAIMTVPTSAQLAEFDETHRLPLSGAHTVGAPDGGAGLPGTGWSVEHGDLRVPHFLGLHAMQLLPLIAVGLGRGRGDAAVRTVRAAAGSYVALFGILLVQALRGEPLLAPGSVTLALFVTWLLLSLAALWVGRTWQGHDRSTLARRASDHRTV